MNLNDWSADDIPTGASNLGDMAIFVWNRARRAKNHVVYGSLFEPSLLIDRRQLRDKLGAADNIGWITIRHNAHLA